jgi:hypothetical protein
LPGNNVYLEFNRRTDQTDLMLQQSFFAISSVRPSWWTTYGRIRIGTVLEGTPTVTVTWNTRENLENSLWAIHALLQSGKIQNSIFGEIIIFGNTGQIQNGGPDSIMWNSPHSSFAPQSGVISPHSTMWSHFSIMWSHFSIMWRNSTLWSHISTMWRVLHNRIYLIIAISYFKSYSRPPRPSTGLPHHQILHHLLPVQVRIVALPCA